MPKLIYTFIYEYWNYWIIKMTYPLSNSKKQTNYKCVLRAFIILLLILYVYRQMLQQRIYISLETNNTDILSKHDKKKM